MVHGQWHSLRPLVLPLHRRISLCTSKFHHDQWQTFIYLFIFRLVIWQLMRGLEFPVYKCLEFGLYGSCFQWLTSHFSICYYFFCCFWSKLFLHSSIKHSIRIWYNFTCNLFACFLFENNDGADCYVSQKGNSQ